MYRVVCFEDQNYVQCAVILDHQEQERQGWGMCSFSAGVQCIGKIGAAETNYHSHAISTKLQNNLLILGNLKCVCIRT